MHSPTPGRIARRRARRSPLGVGPPPAPGPRRPRGGGTFIGTPSPPNRVPPEVAAMHNGSVVKLFPSERYGVIETPDGHEAYFSSDCVAGEGGGFEALRLGDQVSFACEEAEQGMRATAVQRRGEERRS
jgi:cold shock CspA family protein